MKHTIVNTRSPRPRWRTLLAVAAVAGCCSLGPRAAAQQAPPPPRDHGSGYFYTETVLQDGRILVCGGAERDASNPNSTWSAFRHCDLYDPATGQWSEASDMRKRTAGHTASLLPDGRVLVVGGFHIGAHQYSPFVEIYDPATDSWAKGRKSTGGRQTHTATPLHDGTVLIVGGYDNPTYQVFDPLTDTWSTAKKPLQNAIAPAEHSMFLLSDGRVLVVGGWLFTIRNYTSACLLYDRTTDSWVRAGRLLFNVNPVTFTVLDDGGLFAEHGNGSGPYELWSPETLEWRAVDAPPSAARAAHFAEDARELRERELLRSFRASFHPAPNE